MNNRVVNDLVVRYLESGRSEKRYASIVVLHIGEEDTRVAVFGQDGREVAAIVLKIGTIRTSAGKSAHALPTPVELESAIMVVEDEVARAQALITAGSVLLTDDDLVREIAWVAGLGDPRPTLLQREAVENTFERLVAASLGKPSPDLPVSPAFFGTLLILREFMHHLGFSAIHIAG